MKRKTEKQLARETAKHIAMVKQSRAMDKQARKIASRQTEMALLTAAPIPSFCGQLIIQPREPAILKGTEESRYKSEHLVYFVDGAVHMPAKGNHQNTSKSTRRQVKLAAAVAYKATEGSGWIVTSFSVPLGRRNRYYLQAEMSSIAGVLAIAISTITNERRAGSMALHKVIILTDCQSAIHQLQKLQKPQNIRRSIFKVMVLFSD